MDVLSEAIQVLGTKKLWATRKMVFFLGEVAIVSSCQHFFSGQKIGQFSSSTAGVTNYSKSGVIYNRCCSMFFPNLGRKCVFFQAIICRRLAVFEFYTSGCVPLPGGIREWIQLEIRNLGV